MAREMTYFCFLINEVCCSTRDDLFVFSDNGDLLWNAR